jgi:transposase InsO family protein
MARQRESHLGLSAHPGALGNLGHDIGRDTIADILTRHGIEPAPERERKTTWKEFLEQHWDLIVAADFFTIEAWTRRGLQRFIVLFLIELSTRKVEIAGIASTANGLWMAQSGRNLTDAVDGILKGKRYLIHDRDPRFTSEFLRLVGETGVASVKLPPRSPNLNAHAERFVRTIKESCLERLILFGESSVRRAAAEFSAHYHGERNHQGLENKLIFPDPAHVGARGKVQQRKRLGGLLNYYYRTAANTETAARRAPEAVFIWLKATRPDTFQYPDVTRGKSHLQKYLHPLRI